MSRIALVLFSVISMPFLCTTNPKKSPCSSDELAPEKPLDRSEVLLLKFQVWMLHFAIIRGFESAMQLCRKL